MSYNSLNNYLKTRFGCKVYKISLNAGLSCPNRDGTISTGGCIFCSEGGSGDFASCHTLPIHQQLTDAKEKVSSKIKNGKYIAYFQAFTNTYGPIEYLEKIYMEAISDPDVVCLSIGTRPDCLSDDILDLLSKINKIKPVWIELGLQTIHESTAHYINRGYSLNVFETAVKNLNTLNIDIIVHIIAGLPGETSDMFLDTIKYLSHQKLQGIKISLLHVLKNTKLATDFENGKFKTLDMDTYFKLIGQSIELLPPDFVIHRLTGDGPKSILIAPLWTSNKKNVLNSMYKFFKDNNIIQGKKYIESN